MFFSILFKMKPMVLTKILPKSKGTGVFLAGRKRLPSPYPACEQLARTQARTAGGVQVTMDRGEEQAHGIPGRKPVMSRIDGIASGRTSPPQSPSCH